MKNTKNFKGTWSSSFHGHEVLTTPKKMIALAEKHDAKFWNGNTGEDKSNFDFEFLNKDGNLFTVYDWKEYRKLSLNERVDFHIGAATSKVARESYYELVDELNSL